MHDELLVFQHLACQHVLRGEQTQLGRRIGVCLHIHKAALGPLHNARRRNQARAHRPHNLGRHKTHQQRVQQLAAQAVKHHTLEHGLHHRRVALVCLALLNRVHLPGPANQRQLALLQPAENLAVALQVAVQLKRLRAPISALQQQGVIGAQHAQVKRLKRVAQAVGNLGVKRGWGGRVGLEFGHKYL